MMDDAFAEHIIGMTQTLYRVAFSQLSQSSDREDAVQETLRKAWEKRAKLRNEHYLQTWLIRILLNECHNIQRGRSRSIPMEAPLENAPASQPPSEEDSLLRRALLGLEERYRTPILLHYIEGYSLEEVGAILRLPQGTVKSRLSRGRRRLREMLSEEVFEE